MKSVLIVYVILFIGINKLFSQDSLKYSELTVNFEIPSSFEYKFSKIGFYSEYKIEHNPTEEDEKLYEKYSYLLTSIPNEKNYENYYKLACSSWNLGKLDEAEKLFLTIIQSTKPFYTNSYHFNSDIPGDNSTNSYGYGSYTSNYKNYAARYLCEIYLEKNDFLQAESYLSQAKEVYQIHYNCGTGHKMYQDELDRLQILCLQGMDQYEEIIQKYLNKYSENNCANLVNAIQKVYSKDQIFEELIKCESTLVLKLDEFPSQTYTYKNYGKKNEELVIESEYFSGEAKIVLFGQEIELEKPILENGAKVTKEDFLNEFRNTTFYQNLVRTIL